MGIVKGGSGLNAYISERFEEIAESAEIRIKYEGYILREKIVADKIKRLENLKIPEDIDYSELVSISTEARQKLTKIRPANIGLGRENKWCLTIGYQYFINVHRKMNCSTWNNYLKSKNLIYENSSKYH